MAKKPASKKQVRQQSTAAGEEDEKMRVLAENRYKAAMRIMEYYVLFCFVLITFIPLLEYGWVSWFIKFIYLTGAPLLILLFFFSLIKEQIISFLAKQMKKK
ncbi:MAG: hypothetical protein WAN36_02030 [Calditrichia bacterium]